MADTTTPRRSGWAGTTKNTQETGAMLGAKWWAVGDKLACIYQREFETKYGHGHEFMLVNPKTLTVFVDEFGTSYKKQPAENAIGADRQISRFAIPPLAGFDMAVQDMQAGGFPGFRFGDRVVIECVNIQPAADFDRSPMPEFSLSVDPR